MHIYAIYYKVEIDFISFDLPRILPENHYCRIYSSIKIMSRQKKNSIPT